MRYGAMFPGHVLGRIPRSEIDAWVAAVQGLGYDHIATGDHPLGISAEHLSTSEAERWMRGWLGPPGTSPYSHHVVFLEPFTIFAYLAARCDLELVTVSLVLPQRQTALVAKQAAELDYLTGGKLRLCVGVGWSSLEYQALDVPFGTRGRRLDEQIEVLRTLWTSDVVDYVGDFHDIRAAGIQALPVQRPIPLWTAGDGHAALVRAGRLADGWIPPFSVTLGERASACLATIRHAASEAGRDPDAIGLEPMIAPALLDDDGLRDAVAAWRRLGATHILVNTAATRLLAAPGQSADLTMPDHLSELARAARVLKL